MAMVTLSACLMRPSDASDAEAVKPTDFDRHNGYRSTSVGINGAV